MRVSRTSLLANAVSPGGPDDIVLGMRIEIDDEVIRDFMQYMAEKQAERTELLQAGLQALGSVLARFMPPGASQRDPEGAQDD